MIAEKQTFTDKTVFLDGSSFYYCHFVSCKMVYNGLEGAVIDGCSFDGCSWQFDGPAAKTIGFMSALYQQGGEAKTLIEETFKNIRKGK